MSDKKNSLGRKSIRMLAVLGIILVIGTGLAAGIQLYRQQMDTIRSAAEAYANLLWFEINEADIDGILRHEPILHEIAKEFSEDTGADKEPVTKEEVYQRIEEEYGKEVCEVCRLWNEIDSFVVGFGNLGWDIEYAYVVIPEEDELIYIWDSDLDDDDNDDYPIVHGQYSGKEKEHIMAVMQGDVKSDFFTETSGGELIGTALAPVRQDDRIVAVAAIDVSFSKTQKACLTLIFHIGLAILLIMLVSITIYHYLLRKQIIQPIKAISDSMIHFAGDSRTKPEPLNIRSGDEIGEIAKSYEKMTEDISTYVRNIEELTREKVQNNVELEVARRIQNGLVPEQCSLEGEGYRIRAMTCPARVVGGDFYDCLWQDEDNVCVFMGDVSGKGISAAIFMAMTKSIIREKLIAGLSPAEALNQANCELFAQNPECLFATVFAAVLHLPTGELCYANAGHTQPILLKDEPEYLQPDSGIALGLTADAQILDDRLHLAEGEGILLYTDGVTEAMNPQDDFFGTDRLMDAVRMLQAQKDSDNAGVAEDARRDIPAGVSRAVSLFREDSEPFDDMAILALWRMTMR